MFLVGVMLCRRRSCRMPLCRPPRRRHHAPRPCGMAPRNRAARTGIFRVRDRLGRSRRRPLRRVAATVAAAGSLDRGEAASAAATNAGRQRPRTCPPMSSAIPFKPRRHQRHVPTPRRSAHSPCSGKYDRPSLGDGLASSSIVHRRALQLLEQHRGGVDEARRAVAALEAELVEEGLLDRRERHDLALVVRLRVALDGADASCRRRSRRR